MVLAAKLFSPRFMGLWILLPIGLYLAGLTRWAMVFPPLSSDETISSVHGYNLMSGQGNRYSLYDDVFETSIYGWRDATPGLFQHFYNSWVGLFAKYVGLAPWQLRLSSITVAGLALILMARVGFLLGGYRLAYLLAGLLAFNPIFLLSALLVRAEIIVLMGGTLLVGLVLSWREDSPWKAPLLGLIAGLFLTIHQNTVLTFGALVVFYAVYARDRKLIPKIGMLVLGYALGVTVALWPVDLPKFILAERISWYDLYKPPVFSWPWHPVRWLFETVRELITGEPTYFLKTQLLSYWKSAFIIWGGGLVVLSAGGLSPSVKHRAHQGFALAFLALFLALTALIQKKETIYGAVLLPFLIPLAGLDVQRILERRQGRRVLAVLGILLTAGSIIFVRNTLAYAGLCVPFSEFSAQTRRLIPAESKVLAPNILWHVWPHDRVRDCGALVMSKWFTGGRRDIARWMSPWKPDVLIVDVVWIRILLGPGDPLTLLRRAIPASVRPLGQLDRGPGSDGVYQVYQLKWETPS